MSSRSTQTNEVARCAAFLPLLAELSSEIALIEVGASAGLCLVPDRYSYSYDGDTVGTSALEIALDTAGTVSAPHQIPAVAWRAGLDLNPLDASSDEDLRWLRACIWPEHDERRRRLDLAAAIVADDPPRIDRGDLRDSTLALIDQAPGDAVKVVFHSAFLAYVDEASRIAFASAMRTVVADRSDVVWFVERGALGRCWHRDHRAERFVSARCAVSPRTKRSRTDRDHRPAWWMDSLGCTVLTTVGA